MVKVRKLEKIKFSIEFDNDVIPKGYEPIGYSRPKLGDTILIHGHDLKPIVIRCNGNTYFGPCIILEKI